MCPNKAEDKNVKVFIMITTINELKSLVKNISWNFRCRLSAKNVIQNKNRIMISVDVNVKNH